MPWKSGVKFFSNFKGVLSAGAIRDCGHKCGAAEQNGPCCQREIGQISCEDFNNPLKRLPKTHRQIAVYPSCAFSFHATLYKVLWNCQTRSNLLSDPTCVMISFHLVGNEWEKTAEKPDKQANVKLLHWEIGELSGTQRAPKFLLWASF